MHDAPTFVGTAEIERRQPRARRITLTPLKRFSRAHLDLAARPDVRAEATDAMNAAFARLAEQLGHPISAITRIIDGTLQPLQHLGRESLFVVVELSTASTLALIEIEGPVVAHLLRVAAGSEVSGSTVNSLTRIESAALGWLALSAIAGLRSAPGFETRFGPRLVTLTLDRGEALRAIDATLRHLAIELHLTGEHPLGTARVLLPAKMLQLAIQSSAPSEPPVAPEPVLEASLAAAVRFGHATLLRSDVGQLSAGDVIVFAGTRFSGDHLHGAARLSTRSFVLAGAATADGFTLSTITSHPHPESSMATTVNVDVEIELTTIQLPIRQLGTIAPGSVLPLHINAAQQVTLRIGGKAVALAELVEVEGEIGARITAMIEEAP